MSQEKVVTPLQVHFSLKEVGSGFSDVARRASRGGRKVTPQNVRGVVYGYMRKNAEPILAAIQEALGYKIQIAQSLLAA